MESDVKPDHPFSDAGVERMAYGFRLAAALTLAIVAVAILCCLVW